MNYPVLINNRIAIRSESAPQHLVAIEHPVLIEVNRAQQIRLFDLTRFRLNLTAQQPQ